MSSFVIWLCPNKVQCIKFLSLAIRHEGKRFLTMHQLSLYLSNINGEDRVAYKKPFGETVSTITNVHMYPWFLYDDTYWPCLKLIICSVFLFFVAQPLFAMSSIQYSPVFVLRRSVAAAKPHPCLQTKRSPQPLRSTAPAGHVLHAARCVLGPLK